MRMYGIWLDGIDPKDGDGWVLTSGGLIFATPDIGHARAQRRLMYPGRHAGSASIRVFGANGEPASIEASDDRRLDRGGGAEGAAYRPSVQAFVVAMEAALREHDGDRGVRGWEYDSPIDLLDRLREEAGELRDAIINRAYPHGWERIAKEAADVGNFAMMIHDRASESLAYDRRRRPQPMSGE